jgi:hypothetical protein
MRILTILLLFVAAKAAAQPAVLNHPKGVALKMPSGALSALFPAARGSVLEGLDLTDPVLVFAPAAASVALDEEAAKFFGVPHLDVEKGVNLIARMKPRAGSAVDGALKLLGLSLDGVILRGVVLRDFDPSALKEAKEKGELKKALLRGTELRATLPDFRLKGLPKAFKSGRAFLFVTGEPGVGIGFGLTTADGHEFDCDLSVRTEGAGGREVTVFARSKGRFRNAFGIRGFHLDDTRLLLGVDATQNVSFGLAAAMAFGKKPVSIAGKMRFHAVTGAPTGGIFEGSVDSLGSEDLVALANGIGEGRGKPVSAASLPDFSLRKVYVRFAPLGGDDKLGIPSGMALKGELVTFGKSIAAVDGVMDQTTVIPTWKLKGKVRDFDLGIVALKDAAVDINIGPTTNPYYRIKGASRVWISRKVVDIDVSRERLHYEVLDQLDGVYVTHYRIASPAGGRPSWNADATFRNDLTKTIERDVTASALAWAKQVDRDSRKAQTDLDASIARVRTLDAQIAAARTVVKGERAKATADLQRAEADVKRLDGLIAQRNQELDEGLAGVRARVAAAAKARDKAVAKWQAAVKATKKAPLLDKPKKKAIEAAAWTDMNAKKAAHASISAEYGIAKGRIDPELRSLQAARGTAVGALTAARRVYDGVTGGLTVDADPRVAGLITAKATAEAALIVARETVKASLGAAAGAARVTAFATRNNGQVVMIDGASFSGQLAASMSGTRGRIAVQVRWLGEAKTLGLGGSLEDVRRNLAALVWNALKASA